MEFLKSTVQAGLNVFSYFTARRHAEFSLNFNEPQPIYASKRYVYYKSVIIFTFPYHSSLTYVTLQGNWICFFRIFSKAVVSKIAIFNLTDISLRSANSSEYRGSCIMRLKIWLEPSSPYFRVITVSVVRKRSHAFSEFNSHIQNVPHLQMVCFT